MQSVDFMMLNILTEWYKSKERHCLDLRPFEEYQKRHLVPSTSIPLSALSQSFSQLPPRSSATPLLLITPSGAVFKNKPVARHLISGGWNITHTFIDSEELW